MKTRKTIYSVMIMALVVAILFDTTLVLKFGGAASAKLPDPAIELKYENCYQEKDDAMHAVAFATIDNPDVQREFISASRAHIAKECRDEHPVKLIHSQEPQEFNLIDLQPRFW